VPQKDLFILTAGNKDVRVLSDNVWGSCKDAQTMGGHALY